MFSENPMETNEEFVLEEIDRQKFAVVVSVINEAGERNIRISVFGGFGLDGLYGKMTRSHDDLDIFVEDADRDRFKSMLEGLGGELRAESEEKTEYIFPEASGFKVEFAPLSVLGEFTDHDLSEFMPENCNASIDGLDFCAPNLAGQKEIIRIQTKRGAENDWPYPEDKKQNRDEIMKILSEQDEGPDEQR